MNIHKVLIGFVALLLAFSSTQAFAERLYGAVGAGEGTSTLVQLDPDTGSVIATVGDMGHLINGMTWDHTTDTLYGVTSTNDDSVPNALVTIDPETATTTPVSGIDVAEALDESAVPLLTTAPSGVIYGWLEPSEDDLIEWDKDAGTATQLGDAGLSTFGHGLAFDNDGILFLFNGDGEVYEIDPATGASTFLGQMSFDTSTLAHHGAFRPSNNLYYGIDESYGDNPRNIRVIDAETLSTVDSLPTIDDLHVVVFTPARAPEPPRAVPTMTSWGLITFALVLMLAGGLFLRRSMN